MHLYGIGGVGKSFLLAKYKRLSIENKYPVAIIDLRIKGTSVVSVLESVADQITTSYPNSQRYFKKFQDHLLKVYSLLDKLQPPKNIAKTLRESATSGLETSSRSAGTIIGALGGPIGSVIGAGIGTYSGRLLTSAGEKAFNSLLRQGLKVEEARFLIESISHLTESLCTSLNELAENTKRAIIFIDTYEESSDTLDTMIREFLLPNLDSRVLVTIFSREPLINQSVEWQKYLPIMESLELFPFTKPETEEFLNKHGINDTGQIEELYTFSKGLPWALALIIDLKQQKALGEGISHEKTTVRSIVVNGLTRQLQNDVFKTLLAIGSITRFFDPALINVIWPEIDTDRYFLQFTEFSFVKRRVDGSWFIHDVVRHFIEENMREDQPEKYVRLNTLLTDHYLKVINGERLSKPQIDPRLEHFYHLLRSNEEQAIKVMAKEFTASGMLSFEVREEFVRELTEAPPANSNQWAEFGMAYLALHKGNWREAEQRFNALLKKQMPADLQTIVLENLGELYVGRGRYKDAVKLFKKASNLLGEEKRLRSQVNMFNHLAECHAILSNYRTAMDYANKSHCWAENENDWQAIAWAEKTMGDIYRLWGKTKKAVQHFKTALDLFVNNSDLYGEGFAKNQLGRVLTQNGEWNLAEQLLNDAFGIFDDLNVQYSRANALLFLGNIERFRENWGKAIEYYEQALRIHRRMDSRREIGPLLGSMGIVLYRLGEKDRADDLLKQSLEMKKQQEYQRGVAITLIYQGDIAVSEGNRGLAKKCYKSALNLANVTKSNYPRVSAGLKLAVISSASDQEEILKTAKNLAIKYGYLRDLSEIYFLQAKQSLDNDEKASLLHKSMRCALRYNCFTLDKRVMEIMQYLETHSSGMKKRKNDHIVKTLIEKWHKFEKFEAVLRKEDLVAANNQTAIVQLKRIK